jgi:hypothetical protein
MDIDKSGGMGAPRDSPSATLWRGGQGVRFTQDTPKNFWRLAFGERCGTGATRLRLRRTVPISEQKNL